jgi:hypothetical protein
LQRISYPAEQLLAYQNGAEALKAGKNVIIMPILVSLKIIIEKFWEM